jgi:hypothetical protein
MMRLYRGIAVPEASVGPTLAAIRENGLVIEGRFWSGLADVDLKPQLEPVWQITELTTKLTRPKDKPAIARICACAKKGDALYYACCHNRTGNDTAAILITFDVDQYDVVIDGRDFLATVFQLGNPSASREVLGKLFGKAALRYADRAWSTSDQSARIACCDLARQDDEVIAAHAANELVIGGRYRTRFSSAFMVRAPVPAERIISVDCVDHHGYVLPQIDIMLDQALGR